MTHLLQTIHNHLKEQNHNTLTSLNTQPYLYLNKPNKEHFIDEYPHTIKLSTRRNGQYTIEHHLSKSDPQLLHKITQWVNQHTTSSPPSTNNSTSTNQPTTPQTAKTES